MTQLRKMALEELERCNYIGRTIRYYLRFVERFAQHCTSAIHPISWGQNICAATKPIRSMNESSPWGRHNAVGPRQQCQGDV